MTTYWLLGERKVAEDSAPCAPPTKMNAQVSHMRFDTKPPASPILSQRKELANNGRATALIDDSPSEEGIPLLAVTSAQEPKNS